MSVRYGYPTCLLMALAWSASSQAGAARGSPAMSLEWLAADSSLIARGSVVGLATGPGPWVKVAVRVNEVIKGPRRDVIEFVVDGNAVEPGRWRGRELLLFLVENERYPATLPDRPPCNYMLPRSGGDWSAIPIDLEDDLGLSLVNMDFGVITGRGPVLAAARAAVAGGAPGRPRACPVSIPLGSKAFEHLRGGRMPSMIVPVDRLEAKAREWVKSANPYCRAEGVVSLGKFRSDANVLILKSLLSDPALHGRRFLVRQATLEVLEGWGIKCEKPMLALPPPGESI